MDRQVVVARLRRMRTFEDRSSGFREEFLTPELAGGRSIAVLTTPEGETSAAGWVVCHSFGLEQAYLQSIEIPLARRLASEGFPVLRFHGQGYGDSELGADTISVRSHVRGVVDAVQVLVETTGVSRVGLIGARFGGMVAVLSADSTNASRLVLWDPVVSGKTYMRFLARLGVMTELLTHGRDRADAGDPLEVLEQAGVLDVQGFPLSSRVFHEVSAVDLLRDPLSFAGEALILQVSRGAKPAPGLERLRDRMVEGGARVELEVVANPEAGRFGQPRYRPSAVGEKEDTQRSLAARLIAETMSWCRDVEVLDPTSDGGTIR